jgi:hypothetical protein
MPRVAAPGGIGCPASKPVWLGDLLRFPDSASIVVRLFAEAHSTGPDQGAEAAVLLVIGILWLLIS